MANKEKKWFGVTRSPEEDLALVDIMMSSHAITSMRIAAVVLMSVVILGIYIAMNLSFYPGYHVVTPYAEDSDLFTEHYPPFRMHEWVNYSIAQEVLDGGLYSNDSYSMGNPAGFSVLAAPFVAKWGERGIFLANAFIVWACALVFFFIMIEIVEYQLAIPFTLILALATPNLFYAVSAFSETAAQLVLLLSIWFFIKGLLSQSELVFYFLSGAASGLLFFFMPALTPVIVLYIWLVLADRGRFSFTDRNMLGLIGGFVLLFAVFVGVGKVSTGTFFGLLGSGVDCVYDLGRSTSYPQGGNLFAGLWSLLFDSPQGYVFIMPAVVLVPLGILSMWRNELHFVTYITGIILLYQVLLTAIGGCPISGESVGSRQLVPVIPLMVLPLAFIWREQSGERIWLAVLLAMTVYMSSFGWWTGGLKGHGFFIGALQDRDARMIILARKDKLDRTAFLSTTDLTAMYIQSLEEKDIEKWLKTLDVSILKEIEGVERHVFSHLSIQYAAGDTSYASLIRTADPNSGVVPSLPTLQKQEINLDE